MAKKRGRNRPEAGGRASPEASVGVESAARAARQSGEPGRHWAAEWGKTIVIALVLFLILRTFLFQTFVITSGSMEDTLLVGDFLGISKAAYGAVVPGTSWRTPGYDAVERGHIVVFRPPHEPDIDVVKRVIGMPGDTLAMMGKVLHRNGQPVEEPWVRFSDPEGDMRDPWMEWQRPHLISGSRPPDFQATRDNWGPFVVPEGHLFMLGDNRDDSVDSRHWGFLDQSKLRGRVLFTYFSYDSGALSPFPIITAARWDRIFHRPR